MKKVKLCSFALGLMLCSTVGTVYAETSLEIPEMTDEGVEEIAPEMAAYSYDASNQRKTVYLSKGDVEKINAFQKKYKKEVVPFEGNKFIEEPVLKNGVYKLGKFDQKALTSVEKQLNFYRNMAGLKSTPITQENIEFAQHGAIGLAATGQFTHYLSKYEKPGDMPQSFWDTATQATESSNIYMGSFNSSLNSILDTFIQDDGSNNRMTGHRSNILGITMNSFGVGLAGAKSGYSNYSLLYPSVDFYNIEDNYKNDFVTEWPTKNYFPMQLYNKGSFYSQNNMRWSVLFNCKGYTLGENISVEIQNDKTKEKVNVVDDSKGGELTAEEYFLSGYNVVNFKPNDDFKVEKNTTYNVKVKGVLKDEKPITYEYSTYMIDMEDEYVDKEAMIKELAAYKATSKNNLRSYKNNKDYRQGQQSEIENILKDANVKIDKATDKKGVDGVVKEAKTKLDKVKTNKQLTDAENSAKAKELLAYKTDAKKGILNYKDPKNYLEAQKNELISILKEANGKIDKATTKNTVDNLVSETKLKLDKVKTKKELIGEETNPQGPYIKDGRFVTISKKNYSTWSNFSWKKRSDSSKMMNQTYQAKGKYNHENGSTYLSLFDNKGKWQGYINEKAVKIGDGKQGAYISDGRYVTISKDNYDTWTNFAWKSRNKTKNLMNQTYQARGRYSHFNGSTFYSLYDSKGKWYGYLNASAVKLGDGKQGAYIKDGRKVTINKKNYNTWSNFGWKKRQSTSSLMGKSFTARGKYNHINGSTYYSLYDNKGKWYGYLSEHAVK